MVPGFGDTLRGSLITVGSISMITDKGTEASTNSSRTLSFGMDKEPEVTSSLVDGSRGFSFGQRTSSLPGASSSILPHPGDMNSLVSRDGPAMKIAEVPASSTHAPSAPMPTQTPNII